MTNTDELKRGALYKLGERYRPAVDRVLAAHSKVGDTPVFDPATFPWTATLEAGWEAIRDEARAVTRDIHSVPPLREISPDHRIARADDWRSFFLWGYGYRSEENCRRCPETTRLLRAVPGLNSAFFSILKPGAHIPRHRGVTKRLMTCHLGLMVPASGRCEMTVADQTVHWREGRCLVFDDTYFHEVWNDTDQYRVVLLIQFKRPLRQPGRLLGDLFLAGVKRTEFVQVARKNFAAWDGAMKAMDREEGEP